MACHWAAGRRTQLINSGMSYKVTYSYQKYVQHLLIDYFFSIFVQLCKWIIEFVYTEDKTWLSAGDFTATRHIPTDEPTSLWITSVKNFLSFGSIFVVVLKAYQYYLKEIDNILVFAFLFFIYVQFKTKSLLIRWNNFHLWFPTLQPKTKALKRVTDLEI